MNYNKDATVRMNHKTAVYEYLVEACVPAYKMRMLVRSMMRNAQVVSDDLVFTDFNCESDVIELLVNNAVFFAVNAYESGVTGEYLVEKKRLERLVTSACLHVLIEVNDKFVDSQTFLKNLTSDILDKYYDIIAEVSKQVSEE